jgi:hypothetical protein
MADDQRITPLVLDGYDEFGSTDALAALVALGGDAEAFCRDVVAALGAAAARLRHERRAQLVFPSAREHAESLTARLLEIVKARDEAVRLEVPAAASAYRDIARRLELALERAEQEVERHELRAADAAVSRLTEAIASGGDLDSLVAALTAAEARRTALRERLPQRGRHRSQHD